MSKKFIRRKENFICHKCGTKVEGDGYTNHCPSCLWSRHMDNNPGDREASCGGMMKPIGLIKKSGEYKVIHHCEKCGLEKLNKTLKNDNQAVLLLDSTL